MSAATNEYQAQQRFAVRAGSQFDIAATYTHVQYIPGIISSLHSEAIWNTGGIALHWKPTAAWDFEGGYRASVLMLFKISDQEGAATAALSHRKFGDRSLHTASAANRPILDSCRPIADCVARIACGSRNTADQMILPTDFYIHERAP